MTDEIGDHLFVPVSLNGSHQKLMTMNNSNQNKPIQKHCYNNLP